MLRVPEDTTGDTELITVYTLTIYNISAAICRELVLNTLAVFYEQLIITHEG